ncbi:MAG: DUF1080 domain-containing protein [Bacteroidota bacterium]
MNKEFFTVLLICFVIKGLISAQITDPKATEVWEPTPRMITPGQGTAPPSDAIVLFDGKNTAEWTHEDGSAIKWKLDQGHMTVKPGSGGIFTKRTFSDCQLHLEWRAPADDKDEGQNRGNSGVFLQNRYEVQVLDSHGGKTYPNGQAGAIYKQSMPLVNACRPAGEWQAYDIIFKAPVFNEDGIKVAPAFITVLHNGVLIQNHTEIKGTTEYIGLPKNIAHGKGPIQLQDHSELVSYRNIWIREL